MSDEEENNSQEFVEIYEIEATDVGFVMLLKRKKNL